MPFRIGHHFASRLTDYGRSHNLKLHEIPYAEAARLYEEALSLQPAYAPYYINVATARQQAGDLVMAISYLERAIEIDPSLEQAYRKLGEIYASRKQPEKLRETLQRYLNFMPNNVSVQILLDQQ